MNSRSRVAVFTLAAVMVAVAFFSVSPAAAQQVPPADAWVVNRSTSSLEWFVEYHCKVVIKFRAELVEAEGDLSLVTLNRGLVAARFVALGRKGGGTSEFIGGYVVYTGADEYEAAGKLRDNFDRHLEEAESRVKYLRWMIETEEQYCASFRAELAARAVVENEPKPPVEPEPGPAVTDEHDRIKKETGVFDPDKLKKAAEDAKTGVGEAKAAGDKFAAAVDGLPSKEPVPAPKSPPGGGKVFDTTVWPDFVVDFNAGILDPINDPELKGFNQNLVFDPGLDFGVAVSFPALPINMGEDVAELDAPYPAANTWYIIGPGAYAALQTAEPDQVTNQLAPGVLDVSGDYHHYVLMATGGVAFPLGDEVTGELSLGAGLAQTKLKLKGPAGGTIVDDEETVFAWRARASMFFPIAPNVKLGAYANYQDTGDMDMRVVGGPDFTLEGMESFSAGIALRLLPSPGPRSH